MLTNQEKIEFLQSRLLIVDNDISIINKEIQFYQNENLNEKIEVSLNKLDKKVLTSEILKIELNKLFSITE